MRPPLPALLAVLLIVGCASRGGEESPLPSVSGAQTRRVRAKAAISGSSWREEPGEAWSITSGGPDSPDLR